MRMRFDPPTDPAAYQFVHRLRVRFADTDAMGVVHHAAYLLYLEEGRVELLRAVGAPYDVLRQHGVDLPVLEAALRYLQPLRFDEVVEVGARATQIRRTTFQVDYLLRSGGVTRATAVTVHGVIDDTGRPVRMPATLRATLEAAAGSPAATS
jgi:acyl-CoA thioester hydrolase